MVQMKNKISMLLMEAGVSYHKQKLHKAGYFRELLATNPDINEGLGSLLRVCRETVVRLQRTESALLRSLERDSLLMERVERLMTIPAVGPITALTWALEVGDVQRFSSILSAGQFSLFLFAVDPVFSEHVEEIEHSGTDSVLIGRYCRSKRLVFRWCLAARGCENHKTSVSGCQGIHSSSRTAMNCRSTGPDKHVIFSVNCQVIAYLPRGVAALN